MAETLEEPRYVASLEEGPFALRRYEPHVVASVLVEGDRDEASNAGFRVLAGYIFGKNRGEARIAMTAPVSAEPVSSGGSTVAATGESPDAEAAGRGARIAMTAPVAIEPTGDRWKVTFMMPSRYSLQTLPRPLDERVVFEEVPGRCVAAVRFSGFTSDARVGEKSRELAGWMREHGLQPRGAATLARYDAPWTLPWHRRNEVLVEIDEERCAAP